MGSMIFRLPASGFGLVAAAIACVCAALAGCADSPGGGDSCPTLTSACPSPQPSWQTDVSPFISTYCLRCHSEGGVAPPSFNYQSYQGVFQNRSTMSTVVIQCSMPPADASPPAIMPSPAERQTIVSWIACGAPNN